MTQKQNLDELQRSVSRMLKDTYPPIYPQYKTITKEGRECLAVIVLGSKVRPHFAGPSFVRDGSQSIKASERQFDELIAQRSGKAYRILQWRDKMISVQRMRSERTDLMGGVLGEFEAIVETCDSHYVTLRTGPDRESIPLERVSVSQDHARNRLKLEVRAI